MRRALRIATAVTALAVPSVAAAAGAAGAAPAGNHTLAINCGREQYRPGRIILSCGDAGIWLGALKWSRWTATKAVAGTYHANLCTPTCAAGHSVSQPVEVTLTAPQACPGREHPAYRRATFAFPSGAPPHAYRRFTFRCPY